MKRIMTLLVAMGVMTILFGGVAIAAANVAKLPYSRSEIDPCTGQTLTETGVFRIVFSYNQDTSGGNHFISHASFQGTAIGSDGTTYRITSVDNFVVADHNYSTNGATEGTLVGKLRYISQDGSENFVRTFMVHTTVNSNGTPTAEFVNIDNKCVG